MTARIVRTVSFLGGSPRDHTTSLLSSHESTLGVDAVPAVAVLRTDDAVTRARAATLGVVSRDYRSHGRHDQ